MLSSTSVGAGNLDGLGSAIRTGGNHDLEFDLAVVVGGHSRVRSHIARADRDLGDRVGCGPVGKLDCDFLGHGGFFGINHCLRTDGERGGDVLVAIARSVLGSDGVVLVGFENDEVVSISRVPVLSVIITSPCFAAGIVAVQVDRRRSVGEALEGCGGHRAASAAGRAQLDHAVDVPGGFSTSASISSTSTVYIPPAVGLVMPALCLITIVTAGNTFGVGLSVRKCGGNRQDYGIATTNAWPPRGCRCNLYRRRITEKDVAFRDGIRKVEGRQLDIDVLSWAPWRLRPLSISIRTAAPGS